MNKPHIFCFNPGNWHWPWWVDRQHLMSRLAARGWPVTYSNGPLSIWDRGTRSWNSTPFFPGYENISTGGTHPVVVDQPGRIMTLCPKFPKWDEFVVRRHANLLLKRAGNPPPSQRLVLTCYPTFLPYIKHLDARWVALHVFDAWSDNEGWSERDGDDLAQIVERADLITCLSGSMARILPGSGPERAKILPHGVDAHFIASGTEAACPDDLAKIPGPRIGHFGRVTKKIDIELIVSLAKRTPEWNWVFVGTSVGLDEGSPDAIAWSALHEMANVHILGHKATEEIPAYMCHVDANILPFKSKGKGYWNSIFSMKTYEYLATGKPVIGANIENIRALSDVIAVADSEDDWIDAIREAVTNGGTGRPEDRVRLAFENSWDDRAERLETMLENLIDTGDQVERIPA